MVPTEIKYWIKPTLRSIWKHKRVKELLSTFIKLASRVSESLSAYSQMYLNVHCIIVAYILEPGK